MDSSNSQASPEPAPEDDAPRIPSPIAEIEGSVVTVGAGELAGHRDRLPPPPRRRVMLPVVLFLATCVTTFYAQGYHSSPNWGNVPYPHGVTVKSTSIVIVSDENVIAFTWGNGLLYMAGVMAILLTHEMGHFLQALRHRIPASLPFFIPMPLNPLGTLGAVIGMQGSKADRRQLFDIGISGPLAGLAVAVPIFCWGILTHDPVPIQDRAYIEPFRLQNPLLAWYLIPYLRPDLLPNADLTANPLYMAGWVGFLITGLNMMPISQLDGGHVVYGMFGRRAHLVARGFLLAAIAYIVLAQAYQWVLMVVLVTTLIGTDHPPTADDRVPIGRFRFCLGLASLFIPIFCFAPKAFIVG